MARRRRFSKVGINTGLMIDTAIAKALVTWGPGLLNKFLGLGLSAEMRSLAGVALAYGYGIIFKNNNVANIGIVEGAFDFIAPTIEGLIGPMGDYFQMGDYGNIGQLREYTNNLTPQSNFQYNQAY